MNGVLVIDKPAGPTSFDVVKQVRAMLGVKKAGHTGTLDPMATGVLPVCVGEATKIAGYILEGEKAYEAVVRLGVETDTLDAEGKVTAEAPVPVLTAGAIEQALLRFRGTFPQIPPMVSAVKVNGKRLYELARAGIEIERAPRQVTVHELTLRDFSTGELRLFVRCSKGFFVRVLAQEVGRALGCGAHLEALRRTRTGPFALDRAVPLEKLEAADARRRLVPMAEALAELASVTVEQAQLDKVAHGVPVEVAAPASNPVRVLSPGGALLAVADVERGRLKYRRVVAQGGQRE